MELFKELISIERTDDTPVYLQITNAFIQNIRQGRFRKGYKLPGSREAARLLQINRMTAVAAYNELEAQGWIEMRSRKGAFVKSDLPSLTPRKILKDSKPYTVPSNSHFSYDTNKIIPFEITDFPSGNKIYFNDGFPDPRIAPIEDLARNMRRLSRLPVNRKYLMYGGAQGTLSLRDTLANFLDDTRGLTITKENILITRGATMAIYLAASILIKPGDNVIVGQPGYNDASLTFQYFGATINRVPVDSGGIDVDAVENLCSKKRIRMIYLIPHHHNPTTVTLTPERRIHMLDLAARYKFAIIEDDYDYDFHYSSRPMMPMASLDSQGSVIYIGTLTKTLSPAIRIGFMVAPASFIQVATKFRKSIDTQGDSLMENAIAEMYKDGTIVRHIKKSVKLYSERRDYFCKLLTQQLGSQVSFRIPNGGMSVWVKFLQVDLTKLATEALKKGLVMKDGKGYDFGKEKYNSVRLGFSTLNFKEQDQAVKVLKDICTSSLRSLRH